MGDLKTSEMTPVFSRTEVAALLKCSNLTIANRERRGKYPEPIRNSINHRVYSLANVFNLMFIEEGKIYIKPIIGVLYLKGYTDVEDVKTYVLNEFNEFQKTVTQVDTLVEQTTETINLAQ